MKSKVKLVCETCKQEFERVKSEAKRNEKAGRRIFCSLKCTGKKTIEENIPPEKRGDIKYLISNNRLDDYSPFRLTFRVAKRHAQEKGRDFNLTLEYLKQLWDEQKGICPYTGWKLDNPRTSGGKRIKSPTRASLDRKDSSKGYVVGNVQFVCFMANCAKNEFNENELINFCEAVTKIHESPIPKHLSEESHD